VKWYVNVNGKVVGTVIAHSSQDAINLANKKFDISFENGPVCVEKKSLKRKKK